MATSLYDRGSDLGVVTDFRICNNYERDYHRYMIGIASPGGFNNRSAAFVQLAKHTLLWIADWTGCRFLEKAMIPDPSTVGKNWILLDAWLEPYMIALSPNGTTPLYRVSGTYVFGHQNAGSNVYDNTSYPIAPWINGTSIVRTIGASDLEQFLLEPAGVGNGPITGTTSY